MILVPFHTTYFWLVEKFAAASDSSSCGYTEDRQLPDAPIISIIDDDDSMRCAMKSLVTSLGLRVHTFRSAEEFLQSPSVDDTSCLITDVQMPGLSGVELQNVLLARARHMPIILVTAFPEERMRDRAIKAGALGFLSKPFESQMLIKLIEKAIATGPKN
jgi:FixJ family two-component response regulator